jgi:hypothetical protein
MIVRPQSYPCNIKRRNMQNILTKQPHLWQMLIRSEHVADLDEIVRGEFAENADRKDFLPSEIEAIRRAMAPKVATPVGRPAEKVETFHNSDLGKTRDKIGSFAGVSGRTVEKIAAVVKAAEERPEQFGHLVKEMDRTGKDGGRTRATSPRRHGRSAKGYPEPQRGVRTPSNSQGVIGGVRSTQFEPCSKGVRRAFEGRSKGHSLLSAGAMVRRLYWREGGPTVSTTMRPAERRRSMAATNPRLVIPSALGCFSKMLGA